MNEQNLDHPIETDTPADAPAPADDGITLRLYHPQDWPRVRGLFVVQKSPATPAPDDDDDDDEIHDFPFGEGNDIGWVAEADGVIVGVVVARERQGHVAYISHIKEHADWRGRGVALRLASLALAHALESQCLKVVLYSVTHASVAADFERAGLLPAGSHGRPGRRHLDFYLDLYRRLDRGGRPVSASSLSPSPPPRPRG